RGARGHRPRSPSPRDRAPPPRGRGGRGRMPAGPPPDTASPRPRCALSAFPQYAESARHRVGQRGNGPDPAFTDTGPMPALAVAAALRSGCPVADGVFDRMFPTELRFVSFQHWTPVAVARRAAELLVGAGARRLLDVGSGPGKFCIVGALTTLA